MRWRPRRTGIALIGVWCIRLTAINRVDQEKLWMLRRIWIELRTYEVEGVILNLEDRTPEVEMRQVGKNAQSLRYNHLRLKRPIHRA